MQSPQRTAPACLLLIAGCIGPLVGCADKGIERLPRVDTRPMVGEIRQAELDWAWVAARDWYLSGIDGAAPIKDTGPWLRFREHTWLEGGAGCNRFTAEYVRKAEGGLNISQIISTRMFCSFPAGVMQQEARLFHLLQSVDSYHAEPDRLRLLSDGAEVLSFSIRLPDQNGTDDATQP